MTRKVKSLPANQETWVWSMGQEGPLEKGMTAKSNILGWKIPWTEPGKLWPMGLHTVGHDWATHTQVHTQGQVHECGPVQSKETRLWSYALPLDGKWNGEMQIKTALLLKRPFDCVEYGSNVVQASQVPQLVNSTYWIWAESLLPECVDWMSFG